MHWASRLPLDVNWEKWDWPVWTYHSSTVTLWWRCLMETSCCREWWFLQTADIIWWLDIHASRLFVLLWQTLTSHLELVEFRAKAWLIQSAVHEIDAVSFSLTSFLLKGKLTIWQWLSLFFWNFCILYKDYWHNCHTALHHVKLFKWALVVHPNPDLFHHLSAVLFKLGC